MWKHAFAAVASASALLVGAAVPAPAGAPAVPASVPVATATDAAIHAAVARAVSIRDQRVDLALATATDEAAARLVEQRREEAAAAAARAAAEAEAKRVADEQAAAAAAAAAQAAADATAATQRAASTPKAPAKHKPAASSAAPEQPAAPAAPAVRWSTSVVNSGGQDAVDACAGGLTRWYENVDGKPYYPIHRSCGGTPILGLHVGDLVRIDGAVWTVTDSRDVPKGAHYSAAAGLNGQILLQTCYRDDSTMRIVALTPA